MSSIGAGLFQMQEKLFVNKAVNNYQQYKSKNEGEQKNQDFIAGRQFAGRFGYITNVGIFNKKSKLVIGINNNVIVVIAPAAQRMFRGTVISVDIPSARNAVHSPLHGKNVIIPEMQQCYATVQSYGNSIYNYNIMQYDTTINKILQFCRC
jgi:hypothetical protein